MELTDVEAHHIGRIGPHIVGEKLVSYNPKDSEKRAMDLFTSRQAKAESMAPAAVPTEVLTKNAGVKAKGKDVPDIDKSKGEGKAATEPQEDGDTSSDTATSATKAAKPDPGIGGLFGFTGEVIGFP